MKKIILENDFHHTSVVVLVPARIQSQREAFDWLQAELFTRPTQAIKQKYRRVENALCGISGCTCGTVRSTNN